MAVDMEAKVHDIHEYLVATRTHKVGSRADRNDYTNVFRMAPTKLSIDEESNTPLYWDWGEFVTYRSKVEKLLSEKVDALVAVYNSNGFEVLHLQPILSSILQGAIDLVELPLMSNVTVEKNQPYPDTKIIVAGTPYSYHGIADVSAAVAEGGLQIVLSGLEANRGGSNFLTPKKNVLSADAMKACAQCSSQILGFSSVYETLYGDCKAFIQLVVNGREWMLVCSTRKGYRERLYTHTEPVALFPLDTTNKGTALPVESECYTVVAHMIAVMMDCTCSLLRDRQIQSLGAQLKKAINIEDDDVKDEEDENEDMEGPDRDTAARGPVPPKKETAKGTSGRKGSVARGGAAVSSFGLSEENMVTHNMHFGLTRGGLVGAH